MTPVIPAILCGGSGTRLWPMSRAARPKQLLALTGERSLLAETIARALKLSGVAAGDVLLIAGEGFAGDARAEAEAGGAPDALLIVEPKGRNTAPAAALASFAAQERDPNALVLLTPSDHHVADQAAFDAAIAEGAKLAADGYIVTFGIKADSPHTGYGYIKRGEALGGGFRVAEFNEKPQADVAKAYLAEGGRDWNSGIYLFRPDVYLSELSAHAPEVREQAERAWRGGTHEDAVRRLDPAAWGACPSISIDNAVAEKTGKAATVPADIGWSDIGSWAALHEIADKDGDGNALKGDVIALDARNCFVRADGRTVALIGVDDLIVIETGDAVFVAPRARSEEVKKIVETLIQRGGKQPL